MPKKLTKEQRIELNINNLSHILTFLKFGIQVSYKEDTDGEFIVLYDPDLDRSIMIAADKSKLEVLNYYHISEKDSDKKALEMETGAHTIFSME